MLFGAALSNVYINERREHAEPKNKIVARGKKKRKFSRHDEIDFRRERKRLTSTFSAKIISFGSTSTKVNFTIFAILRSLV